MKEAPQFWSGWRDRLSALRNVPTVLHYVWESGRSVVILGLLARVVASLLPPALFWVSKLIIDAIFRIVTTHQPITHYLWWLVAAEFALALAQGLVGRVIDYTDALLAGKYMNYISVRVMEHAASLDLIAYEDPVFYDRLERARVQATDRLYMIQAMGRLMQQVITTVTLSISIMLFSPWLLLILIVGVIPAFVGETHFAFLGYAKNFRQTPSTAAAGLSADPGRKQGSSQGVETVWAEDFLTGKVQTAFGPGLRRRYSAGEEEGNCRVDVVRHWHGRVLHGLHLRCMADGYGRLYSGYVDVPGERDSGCQFEFAADVLDFLDHCGPGLVSHGSDCVL